MSIRAEPLGEPNATESRRGLRVPRVWLLLAAAAVVVVGALSPAVKVLVPDTSSPFAGTGLETVNQTRSIGQSFRAERDGLARIEMVLAASNPTGDDPLHVYLREMGYSQPVRTVAIHPARLLRGEPWQYVPGRIDERWFAIDFEPIPDSAGKRYYLGLEGPGIPVQGSVKTLIFYHNGYPEGQAYIDGQPVNAHLVFRAYSYSRPGEALQRIVGHLVSGRPGPLGEASSYVGLAALYIALSGSAARIAWRAAASGSQLSHGDAEKGTTADD